MRQNKRAVSEAINGADFKAVFKVDHTDNQCDNIYDRRTALPRRAFAITMLTATFLGVPP